MLTAIGWSACEIESKELGGGCMEVRASDCSRALNQASRATGRIARIVCLLFFAGIVPQMARADNLLPYFPLSVGQFFIYRCNTVAKVAEVTARDSNGRAQRFKDAGDREFAVTYDAQQRVQSVQATRGAHLADIVSVGYTPDGKLLGVKFRTGYTLFYDHRPDGSQVIRDSLGQVMVRDSSTAPLRSVERDAQSGKMVETVAQLEALVSALRH